jgi:aspartyl/glutamyl-tRNA(Asn/Gln) amidotransferase C subunit
MKEEIDINKLALLSRLALSPEEKESLQKDLDSILGYISQIKEVKVPPLVDTEASFRNQFREDGGRTASGDPFDLAQGKNNQALLKALPTREGDYMVVQKILDINA